MEWISIEDHLPPSGEYVLIHDKFGYMQVAVYMEPEKCWYDAINVIHWMKLPFPPLIICSGGLASSAEEE